MVAELRRVADIAVAPMRRRHLRAVLDIEHRVYPTPWTGSLFLSELVQRATRRYLVALGPPVASVGGMPVGRPVVGYAGILVQVGEAHITTVAVHPDWQERGVATRLLLGLVAHARRAGADAATLEVRVSNVKAQRLYERFGFETVGVRPGYYAETGEDAAIMWAYDLQSDEYAARLAEIAARVGVRLAPGHDTPGAR